MENEKINILVYYNILKKKKKTPIISILISLLVGIIYYFSATPIYQSVATIYPISGQNSSIQSKLSLLSNMGISSSFLGSNYSSRDVFEILLKSRTLAEKIIKKNNLQPIIHSNIWDKKKTQWKKKKWLFFDVHPPNISSSATTFINSCLTIDKNMRTSLISIIINLDCSECTGEIANLYVTGFQEYLNESIVSDVKRTRVFIGKQLEDVLSNIKHLEKSLIIFSEGKDTISINSSISSVLNEASETIATIASKEVELLVLENISKDREQYNKLKKELEMQKNEMLNKINKATIDGSEQIIIPISKVPLLALEYGRLDAEHKIQSQMYSILKQKYELARIDESKEEISFISIDPAVGTGSKLKPKLYTVFLLVLVGLFMGIVLVFAHEFYTGVKNEFKKIL
ncbi:MAG: Wzz/FepE/Etk N-terminal domain-containing protein [Pseudomonadota bacterium]